MTIEQDIYTLPAYYASAFVNGDYSGLEGRDRRRAAAIERWLARKGWRIVSVVDDQEPRFTWSYYLYHGLARGGEVLDYVVLREVRRKR